MSLATKSRVRHICADRRMYENFPGDLKGFFEIRRCESQDICAVHKRSLAIGGYRLAPPTMGTGLRGLYVYVSLSAASGERAKPDHQDVR